MGKRKNNELVVETGGNCFLCSTRILPEQSSVNWVPRLLPEAVQSSLRSLQCLSRYLKLDISTVLNQNVSIPKLLLDKVERSNLMVELCSDCAKLIERFSVVYGQLKRVQMEVTSLVEIIHGKLTSDCDQLSKLSDSNVRVPCEFTGEDEIARVVKTETIRNCSRKLSTIRPRLKIQKLTTEQINKKGLKKKWRAYQPKIEPCDDSPVIASFENLTDDTIDIGEVKLEHPTPQTPLNDDDSDGNDSNFDADSRIKRPAKPVTAGGRKVAKTGKRLVLNEKDLQASSKPLPASPGQMYRINPKTRKPVCKICSKEFFDPSAANKHFKAVHLNVRYKCALCEMEFKYNVCLQTHQKIVHLGVYFKCETCGARYTRKDSLERHKRIKKCGK